MLMALNPPRLLHNFPRVSCAGVSQGTTAPQSQCWLNSPAVAHLLCEHMSKVRTDEISHLPFRMDELLHLCFNSLQPQEGYVTLHATPRRLLQS